MPETSRQPTAQLLWVVPAEYEEEFRCRLHVWVEEKYLLSAYGPLGEIAGMLPNSITVFCVWLGDAAGTDGDDYLIDQNRLCSRRARQLCERHGTLGGQACADDVEGEWKDLTEDVWGGEGEMALSVARRVSMTLKERGRTPVRISR
ncbi:Histidine protein kinase NIK1 [Apiospora saccharicola]|uniref:Histidine protein kinase NIK1 n=1 Tax=Apiospora saccharicola TaxID=335842 RepID=A0ABR1W4L6_9PEZI